MNPTDPRTTLSLQQIDGSTRMFLVSLCLGDADLVALGLLPGGRTNGTARRTAARSALQRRLATEPTLARHVADRLDLRHLERVSEVRAQEPTATELRLREEYCGLGGEALAGWAWALLTDGRREVCALGRRLMSECFVRAMGLLAAEPGGRPGKPGLWLANETQSQ